MKQHFLSCTFVILLAASAAHSQSPAPGAPPVSVPARTPNAVVPNEPPKLTRFNLDFPGGDPAALVAAIEKAMGRPLNVVIPDEYAADNIPALRMTLVTVPDLFRAMELACIRTIPYRNAGFGGYQQLQTTISFQTSGAATDDSIWYFRGRQQPPDLSFLETKPAPVKASRFYALTPYLEQGLKVEDITTAVQTAWKMLGEKQTPDISFHKETKLLIAVGEPGKLDTIDAVLNALRPGVQLPVGANFSDRVKAILSEAASAPVKTEAANPKPAVPVEKKP
ncbi:MAG: hypothetical protein QM813_12240 [Verrucomicrobiota bacterium]